MIQLLGSFCGHPASAMRPGTLAAERIPYTPDRSARRSRMPVAASALASGFGAWASFGPAESIASSTPQMASSFKFILTPCFLTGLNIPLISSKRALPRNLYCLAYAVKKRQKKDDRNRAIKSSRREGIRTHLDLIDLRWRGGASFIMEYRACGRCRPESTAFPASVWIVDTSVDVLAKETHRLRNMDVDELTVDER